VPNGRELGFNIVRFARSRSRQQVPENRIGHCMTSSDASARVAPLTAKRESSPADVKERSMASPETSAGTSSSRC